MQKLTYGSVVIYVTLKVMTSLSFRDVIAFFNILKFNKSLRQFLHLNGLFPFAFVSSKKDGSRRSFRSFCFQVYSNHFELFCM